MFFPISFHHLWGFPTLQTFEITITILVSLNKFPFFFVDFSYNATTLCLSPTLYLASNLPLLDLLTLLLPLIALLTGSLSILSSLSRCFHSFFYSLFLLPKRRTSLSVLSCSSSSALSASTSLQRGVLLPNFLYNCLCYCNSCSWMNSGFNTLFSFNSTLIIYWSSYFFLFFLESLPLFLRNFSQLLYVFLCEALELLLSNDCFNIKSRRGKLFSCFFKQCFFNQAFFFCLMLLHCFQVLKSEVR